MFIKKTNETNGLTRKAAIWLQCLGLCMTYPMATANISGSTITVTAPAAPAAPAVTTKPFVDLHGFSYGEDTGSMDFALTINTAEMLWLNQLKTTTGYNPDNQRYLLPVGKFQYCLDATDKTNGVYMKVNISDGSTNGFVNTNNDAAVIAGYALVYGNGSASGGAQELFFGSDASLNIGGAINRLNLGLSTSLDTSTSALDQMAETSEFSGTALTSIANIDSNSSNFTQLNHYHLPDGEYTLTSPFAATRSDLTFVYDKTAFHDGVCGTGNAGAIDVVIFMNIADIISQPAGVYQGTIQLTFDNDG
ncbi:MAG: hypothetical protein VX737_05270 [Pseudomonadota bacterium]|nr:hypothetical protein [Pseudomonadota bacterium]